MIAQRSNRLASLLLVSAVNSLTVLVTRARSVLPATRARSVQMSAAAPSVGTLYDVPVSNNGARCRMILYYKGIGPDEVAIVSPMDLGGLKSEAFLAKNPQVTARTKSTVTHRCRQLSAAVFNAIPANW